MSAARIGLEGKAQSAAIDAAIASIGNATKLPDSGDTGLSAVSIHIGRQRLCEPDWVEFIDVSIGLDLPAQLVIGLARK